MQWITWGRYAQKEQKGGDMHENESGEFDRDYR